MSSIFIVVLLVFIACLPLALAWVYFCLKQKAPAAVFLFAMLSGFISVLMAAGTQVVIAPLVPSQALESRASVLYKIFVEIALTEEFSRFLAVFVFSLLLRKLLNKGGSREAFLRTFGLFAGFTFAAIETIFFTMTNIDSGLIRAVSAAPLHGACGIRISNAVLRIKTSPLYAVFSLLSAVALHGVYNFLAQRSGFFPYLAAAISVTALLAGLQTIVFSTTGENQQAT